MKKYGTAAIEEIARGVFFADSKGAPEIKHDKFMFEGAGGRP
jgi:hypothetical protein